MGSMFPSIALLASDCVLLFHTVKTGDISLVRVAEEVSIANSCI